MNILFIGDIVGKVGKKAIKLKLKSIIKKFNIDFVIANGENVSNGKGIYEKDFIFLLNFGVDVITLGNHYHAKQQIDDFVDDEQIIRPLNLKDYNLSSGSKVYEVNGKKIRVTSLIGQIFMPLISTNPYDSLSKIVENDNSDIHIVDFHAETTSEKKAYAYKFLGKISALIGTHTHVQTNDEEILEDKTFYISDVGMCGSLKSIIGGEINSSIDRTIFNKKDEKIKYDDEGKYLFNAVVMEFDDLTSKPLNIKKIREVGE